MGDLGLYTSLYSQLSDCAELIDDVIIDLELTNGNGETKQRKALSGLLRTLDTAPTSDLRTVLLWNVLRENKGQQHSNWGKIADAIDRGDASKNTISHLEKLARVLELEQAKINARMHGYHVR